MKRWDEVPVRSLQYRMAEVGRCRLEPRLLFGILARALSVTEHEAASAVLVANSDGSISQARDPSLELRELLAEAARSTQNLEVARCSKELVQGLPSVYRSSSRAEGSTGSRVVVGSAFAAAWARVMVSGPSGEVDVVMSHDLDWFSARTEFFWHFANEAAERDAALVFVVRKAAPATFLVCRELGARVVQYYSTLCHEENASSVGALSRDHGWFHTLPIEALRQHAVTTLLDRQLESAVQISRKCLQEGLGEESVSPRASDEEWGAGVEIERRLIAANERAVGVRAPKKPETPGRETARSKQRKREESELFGRPTEVTRLGIRI